MPEEDKNWETYLLSIGVVDLNNQEEIDEKLATSKDYLINIDPLGVLRDKIERENPEYETNIVEALKEIKLGRSTPITDIRAWLESLGD